MSDPLTGRIHRTAFGMLERVYHVTDADREDLGIITRIYIQPDGHSYQVTWPDRSVAEYYPGELTRPDATPADD